jgi:broad specificity phosphatase PhoE
MSQQYVKTRLAAVKWRLTELDRNIDAMFSAGAGRTEATAEMMRKRGELQAEYDELLREDADEQTTLSV